MGNCLPKNRERDDVTPLGEGRQEDGRSTPPHSSSVEEEEEVATVPSVSAGRALATPPPPPPPYSLNESSSGGSQQQAGSGAGAGPSSVATGAAPTGFRQFAPPSLPSGPGKPKLTAEEEARLARNLALLQHIAIDTYVAGGKGDTECVICMVDFEEGEEIRFLPCLHTYHRDCIDDWLLRSFTCPACMEPVDSALFTSYLSGEASQLAALSSSPALTAASTPPRAASPTPTPSHTPSHAPPPAPAEEE